LQEFPSVSREQTLTILEASEDTLLSIRADRQARLQLMHEAVNDELFLADLNAAMEDFKNCGARCTSAMNFSRWSIWQASLDPVIGSEQGKSRPVLVISDSSLNNILPGVNCIPVTSRKMRRRIYPNEAFLPAATGGLEFDSIALCYQIRTLDKPSD
jgi:mRNA interferase MazF